MRNHNLTGDSQQKLYRSIWISNPTALCIIVVLRLRNRKHPKKMEIGNINYNVYIYIYIVSITTIAKMSTNDHNVQSQSLSMPTCWTKTEENNWRPLQQSTVQTRVRQVRYKWPKFKQVVVTTLEAHKMGGQLRKMPWEIFTLTVRFRVDYTVSGQIHQDPSSMFCLRSLPSSTWLLQSSQQVAGHPPSHHQVLPPGCSVRKPRTT